MHSRRAGFTFIELLIVIVIIGILAAIALPRLAATRERAYYRAMMADLRNLVAKQEIYFAIPPNYTYTSDTAALQLSRSEGVVINLAPGASPAGWQATATHAGLYATQTCGVYVGTPSTLPPAYVTAAGLVTCTNE